MQLIAIVTDGLTDSAITGDLYSAASRGVSVYIILNQRSIQEKLLLNRLQHQVSQHLEMSLAAVLRTRQEINHKISILFHLSNIFHFNTQSFVS